MTSYTTHYMTLTEYRLAIKNDITKSIVDAVRDDMLDRIEEISREIDRACNRRFDERIETRKFSPYSVQDGGDVDGRRLIMDDDLLSATAVHDALSPATALDPSLYDLHPINSPTHYGVIQLIDQAAYWGYLVGNIAYHTVTGLWGYGQHSWVVKTTLNGALDGSSATFTATSGAALELKQTLKIDSEYVQVESISSNTITVTRAVNGSTAASHLSGATVYAFRVSAEMRKLCKRMAEWWNVQDKAPDGYLMNPDGGLVNINKIPPDIAPRMGELRRASLPKKA